MAIEYKLPYTANEINTKLGMVEQIYDEMKSKITLEITQNTTNTLTNIGDTQNWAAQAEYHPNQGLCFMRTFCTSAGDMVAGTAYTIGTLADLAYVPEYTTPLSVMCSKHIQAYIGSAGNIIVKPYEDIFGTVPIRVAGFWFK